MTSRKADAMKQRLLEERDRLLKEREAIDNQIAGLERAISLIANDSGDGQPSGRSKRVSIKATVLDLLEEVGTTGLNAAVAVDLANRRGISLDRGSVSSLLSRLKAEEIVAFDGDKYRVMKFASTSSREREAAPRHGGANVVGIEARRS